MNDSGSIIWRMKRKWKATIWNIHVDLNPHCWKLFFIVWKKSYETWKSDLRQTFCIPDTGLRSGSREFSHISHESEVSPLLGGESRHEAEFGDKVHKRRLMTHFRRSLLGTFQPITREKGYFIGLSFTPLHLYVHNIVKNSKDLLILKSMLLNSISKDLLVLKSMLFYPINDGQTILSASMKI